MCPPSPTIIKSFGTQETYSRGRYCSSLSITNWGVHSLHLAPESRRHTAGLPSTGIFKEVSTPAHLVIRLRG